MAGTIISTVQVMVGVGIWAGTVGMDQITDGDGIIGTDQVMVIMDGDGTTIIIITDITITIMYIIAE